jgi:hypothetical protein
MSSVRIGRDDFKDIPHGDDDHKPFERLHFGPERRAAAIPPVPDLRFEYTYLKNIRPHVHIEHSSNEAKKGADSSESSATNEVVHVEWSSVLWITLKEQLISPLVQGALWYVYVALNTVYCAQYFCLTV